MPPRGGLRTSNATAASRASPAPPRLQVRQATGRRHSGPAMFLSCLMVTDWMVGWLWPGTQHTAKCHSRVLGPARGKARSFTGAHRWWAVVWWVWVLHTG